MSTDAPLLVKSTIAVFSSYQKREISGDIPLSFNDSGSFAGIVSYLST